MMLATLSTFTDETFTDTITMLKCTETDKRGKAMEKAFLEVISK